MLKRLEQTEDLTLDMAPLIDCVFLLLIFFLVATTLKKLDRELPVELPSAAMGVQTKLDDGTLVIGLDTSGVLYLQSEPVTIEQFHAALRAVGESDEMPRVRIDADRAVPYESILHVVDQCRFWGIERVGFHIRSERQRAGGRSE